MGLVRTSLLGAGLAAGFAGLVLMIALGDGGFVIVCVGGFVLILAGVVLPRPGTAPRSRQLVDQVRPPAPQPTPAPEKEPQAEVTPPQPKAEVIQVNPKVVPPKRPALEATPEPVEAKPPAPKPANVPMPDPPPPDGVELLVGKATQVRGSPAVVAGIAALSAGAVVLARRFMRR